MNVPTETVPPLKVSTVRGPVAAPTGTVAVIMLSLTTVNIPAMIPPNDTDFAPVKPEPVIVTDVPTRPLGGVKIASVAG